MTQTVTGVDGAPVKQQQITEKHSTQVGEMRHTCQVTNDTSQYLAEINATCKECHQGYMAVK